MAATTTLREALNRGVSSGNLVDTKIILYSRRETSGRVSRPKALYANSHVLKTVPYFKDLFSGDFAESQSKDFKSPIDEEEYREDYEYVSDSDLEDDEDEKASFKHASKPEVHSFDPFATAEEDKLGCENYEERLEKGKVVKISDIAFVTFQAFLMYLYTNVIEFAPFGSQENRRSRSAEIINSSDEYVPRPSPKSIYRLADKYDVPVLKTLALNHIQGELAECDIVEEAFSRFASRHDEIRNLYIQQLAFNWMEDSTTKNTHSSVKEKINSFVKGDLERATEVLYELLEIASKDEDLLAPTNTSPVVVRAVSHDNWTAVRIALIKSIREGVFFDRKYWARHYKAGDVLKPICFSSACMGGNVQLLKKLVKHLKGRNPPVSDLEGDVNIESDCEGDLPGVRSEPVEMKGEGEEPIRAVLTVGSFPAWRSLFFYRCTGEISFAPLKSQGVDPRLNYIREKTVAAAPPPCSPKSIYVLANLLEIFSLREEAFANIKSKMTLDNVVGEVFSWVAAGQKQIMRMQCDLLVADLKNPKIMALVKENLEHISEGSSSHCAGAVNLMLEKAFEFKKQSKGVKLRCAYRHCWLRENPVSYSSVGSRTLCLHCEDEYMECVGCGLRRDGNYSSCQGCRKMFI